MQLLFSKLLLIEIHPSYTESFIDFYGKHLRVAVGWVVKMAARVTQQTLRKFLLFKFYMFSVIPQRFGRIICEWERVRWSSRAI